MNPNGLSQKIVIVEDNVSLADIYKTRLELLGYTCYAAYDGEEALAVIQRELPDLVLLDLMVPKIAGDQILARMRASDWGKNIRVLIVSNLNEADAPAGLRAQGIEGYAVKANLSNDQLDQLVDHILKPADQQEDVLLETKEPEVSVGPAAPAAPPVSPALAPAQAQPPLQPVVPPAQQTIQPAVPVQPQAHPSTVEPPAPPAAPQPPAPQPPTPPLPPA